MNELTTNHKPVETFLSGGGEMGERIRAFDWSQTSLGPVEHWPRSLRTCVQIMLTSRQPIWIGWGNELIKLYNDPYKAIVRGKHPWALGKPASVVWSEIWKDIDPMLAKVMNENEGTYVEEQLLIMERNGYPEETYYTFSYTPVAGDDGVTGGMICANTDDTERIISQRQLRTLTSLGNALADLKTDQEVLVKSVKTFEDNPFDFPFSLIYTYENETASLFSASDLGKSALLVPESIRLNDSSEVSALLRKASVERKFQIMEEVTRKLGVMPTGAWEVPPDKAIILPIAHRGQTDPYGFLVVGVNPYRLLDEKYISFFNLAADQIATSLSNLHVIEEERKRLEALAEIDRAKTIFFSNISHEFRTPLTLLLGPIEDIARDPFITPPQREKAEVALRNAQRMQKLVNMLLDFSRIEAGRLEGTFAEVDIASITEDLASNFRSAVQRAGMQLNITKEPIIGPVFVDVDMWEKIILNLVSNAFKYTEAGTIELAIRNGQNENIEVSVKDTGVGIPPEELPRIFERFHRVDSGKGRSQEGTGIGLAMVKELVKLHGGTIRVESEFGKGSIFTISLPTGCAHLKNKKISPHPAKILSRQQNVFTDEAAQWLHNDEPNASSAHAGQNRAEEYRRHIVLLADDNADMRKYVERLLEPYHQVVVAADGMEAYEKALLVSPDLILSDIMMPNLDGFGLLKKLRSNLSTRNIPVIFLSARAGEEAKVEGLKAGADDYLTKPFSSRELIARVNNHISISTARRKTEREFFNLFHQSPAHIHVMKGPEHIFEFFHPLGISFTGRDITGMKVREALPELEGQGFFELLDKVYQEGETIHLKESKASFKDKNGSVRIHYFDITYLPWRDLEGRIQGVLQFTFEVTETVENRLRAEANEKKFRQIAQQAPVAMALLMGPSHVIEVANDRVLELWGKEYQEVINKPVLEVFPEIVDQGFRDLLSRVYHTGEPFVGKEVPVTFTRDEKPFRIFVDLLYEPFRDEHNQIAGIVAVGTDVTQQVMARKILEEAEYKLTNAIELAQLGTWHIDLMNNNYIEYSKRIAQWWGLTGTSAGFEEVLACVHPDDRTKVRTAIARAISESGYYEAEYRLIHSITKQQKFIQASGKVFYDDEGSPIRLSGIARDVTLEKMTQQELEKLVRVRTLELQESNNDLLRSNEYLRQFAYVASHDLQEPLRKILTYSDLLRIKNKDNKNIIGKDYLEKIAIGSQRMSTLIRDLLDFSQAESKDQLFTEVDLNRVVNNIKDDFEVTIAEKKAEIRIAPLNPVFAIELQMNQLFYNLIGNALKFTRNDVNPLITISSRLLDDAEIEERMLDKTRVFCEIEIADNGIGFDQKFSEQIFVLFQRLHVKDQYQGTGIGLALCKKIVENHKGQIVASGNEGVGAVFKISLPVTR